MAATTRIATPAYSASCQLSRLRIRHDARPTCCLKSLHIPSARLITTSPSLRVSVSTETTRSVDLHVPIKPLADRTVLATIHHFPTLEPLRFELYPANHLHLPIRRDILHRAVIYEGDKTRSGTASTKTRYEVHGSRRKIRPQKGSGAARLGDKKSPMLRGGGVAFGPHPRDFATKLQKKVYDLAWRTALSYRFRKGELIIVDNAMELESPSALLLEDIFRHHNELWGKGRSLLVTLEERPLLAHALADINRGSQSVTWDEVDVKDLLELSRIIIERDALHNILSSHQEDLTHRALHPGHNSLVRSSPAHELKAIPGWQEFQTLSLILTKAKRPGDTIEEDAKRKDAARAEAYEKVAASRYTHAETLPEGEERIELSVSAYHLLADAKELQFQEKTGFPFAEYRRLVDDDTISELDTLFPRIQALDYQISVKEGLAETAVRTSSQKERLLKTEILDLKIQRAEVLYDAHVLVAQVHEHRAEARSLAGEVEVAEELLALATLQRTNIESLETALHEAKLVAAVHTYAAARERGDDAVVLQALDEEVMRCNEAMLEFQLAAAEQNHAVAIEMGDDDMGDNQVVLQEMYEQVRQRTKTLLKFKLAAAEHRYVVANERGDDEVVLQALHEEVERCTEALATQRAEIEQSEEKEELLVEEDLRNTEGEQEILREEAKVEVLREEEKVDTTPEKRVIDVKVEEKR